MSCLLGLESFEPCLRLCVNTHFLLGEQIYFPKSNKKYFLVNGKKKGETKFSSNIFKL